MRLTRWACNDFAAGAAGFVGATLQVGDHCRRIVVEPGRIVSPCAADLLADGVGVWIRSIPAQRSRNLYLFNPWLS